MFVVAGWRRWGRAYCCCALLPLLELLLLLMPLFLLFISLHPTSAPYTHTLYLFNNCLCVSVVLQWFKGFERLKNMSGKMCVSLLYACNSSSHINTFELIPLRCALSRSLLGCCGAIRFIPFSLHLRACCISLLYVMLHQNNRAIHAPINDNKQQPTTRISLNHAHTRVRVREQGIWEWWTEEQAGMYWEGDGKFIAIYVCFCMPIINYGSKTIFLLAKWAIKMAEIFVEPLNGYSKV